MANIINGDNGVVSGTAGLKSSSDGTGILALQTNGTTAVTVDASQNVGIGQSSITQAFGGYTQLNISGSNGATIQMQSGSTTRANIVADGNALYIAQLSGSMQFAVGGSGTGTERMRLDASGNLLFNSGYGSVATAYGCRAWVNFNGTGTVAIRASGNVTSITDNGTGDYTVNLTTAMPDVNYSICGAVGNTTSSDKLIVPTNLSAPTTSAFRIGSTTTAGAYNDNQYVWASIFR